MATKPYPNGDTSSVGFAPDETCEQNRFESATQIADPPSGWWSSLRYLGPGMILSAAVVGSGELIATTALGAKAGFALLWVILLGCLLKVGVQLEFGRHAICHGISSFPAWNGHRGVRFLNLHWSVFAAVLYYLSNIFGQAGVIGSAALVVHSMFPGLEVVPCTWALAIAVALMVLHGRYGIIEKTSLLLNVLFVALIGVCVVSVQYTPFAFAWSDVTSGLRFHLPQEVGPLAFAAFGITGVAAGEIFIYPSWCLEKGYSAWVGPRDKSDAWARRAKGWIRVMQIDALLSMAIYTLSTIGFYCLGASILSHQPALQDGNQLIFQLSAIATEVLGPDARMVFMTCAFFVLFSTSFSNNASNSRLWTDFLELCGVIRPDAPRLRTVGVAVFACGLPIAWTVLFLTFRKPLLLVTAMGIANSAFLVVVAQKAIVYRYWQTDGRVQPSRLYDTYLWLSVGAIAIVAAYAAFRAF